MMDANKQQFAQTINQHKGIIYKIVNAYCANKEDRKDLAQEMVTTLWLSFDSYNSEFRFSTWMYRVALNVAISFYRKDKKHHNNVSIEEHDIINIAEPSQRDGQSEEIKQLYRFINQLDKLNKAIILLYLENESYQSIANTLGISTSNVGTRVSRIKQDLTQQFFQQDS